VVLSQIFNVPSIAVDTHVHRLALRWGLTKEEKKPNKVQEDLCATFPREVWSKAHLQMIYFGREYCSAKGHTPSECPICSWVRDDVDAPPPSNSADTSPTERQFSPQKKSKNIVYYDERLKDLEAHPELSPLSRSKGKLIFGGGGGGDVERGCVVTEVADSIQIKGRVLFDLSSFAHSEKSVDGEEKADDGEIRSHEEASVGGSTVGGRKRKTGNKT
jgi:hypothetical protein